MTTRSAASIERRLGAARGQQATGHLLGVAPVHLAAERPDPEARQRLVLGPELGPRARRRPRRPRRGPPGAGPGGSDVEDGQLARRHAVRPRHRGVPVAERRRGSRGGDVVGDPRLARSPRRRCPRRRGSRCRPRRRAGGAPPRPRIASTVAASKLRWWTSIPRRPAAISSSTTPGRRGAAEKWASTGSPPAAADRRQGLDAGPSPRAARSPACRGPTIRAKASCTSAREAGLHERPGDRRPAQRLLVGAVQPLQLGVDRQPDLAQPREHPLEATPAGAALALEERLEARRRPGPRRGRRRGARRPGGPGCRGPSR